MIRLICACTLLLAVGCQATRGGGTLQHVVLFSLKNPDQAAELIEACRTLERIDAVHRLVVGKPVDLGRPEVDGSYDVGLIVEFASEADYREYIDDPIHVTLVGQWQQRFGALRVFDFR